MSTGIHHVTLITRKVQANVDFYVGFLGLRLVKRTGGYEDATQLHLLYGDAEGSPGTLVTFLVWEDGAPGRVGHGQPSEIALAIEPSSIGFWLTRALSFHIPLEGPAEEIGEPVLRLKDPDGVIVKLVGVAGFDATHVWAHGDVPAGHAVRRIRSATLLTEMPEMTEAFLARHFGYRTQKVEGSIRRMVSTEGDALDIRDAQGFWTAAPGTGTIDHIALRARDRDEIETARVALATGNSTPTTLHDRKYFHSLYVREPGGSLLELATNGPGMTVDETPQTLGTELFVPDSLNDRIDELRVVLPQFALPGEERIVYRELPFVHRFHTPQDADGSVLVLLHGSGGSETGLMPFAAKAAPRATLLGLRGRSTEEGSPRWFRRLGGGRFDQADIRAEAEALAAFVEGATQAYGLDPSKTVFVGHSNGANMLAALMLLHPQAVRNAVLLRPTMVLEEPPEAALPDAKVLALSGDADLYAPEAETLFDFLRKGGAEVEARTLEKTGHEIGPADAALIGEWVRETTGG